METNVVGLGTWGLGGRAYGPVPTARARAALDTALDAGVRVFDTADIYGDGRAERLLGRALAGRSDVIVISKIGYVSELGGGQDFAPGHLRRAARAVDRGGARRRAVAWQLVSAARCAARATRDCGEWGVSVDGLLRSAALIAADDSLMDALAGAVSLAPPFDASTGPPVAAQHGVLAHVRRAGGTEFGALERQVTSALESEPHAAVVLGLPADESGRLLVALSRMLGVCLGQAGTPDSSPVRRIEAASQSPERQALRLEERLHTDATNWPIPNDFTLLQCIRADAAGGGRSRILSATALAALVNARYGSAALAAARAKAVPWAIAGELGGGVGWEPMLPGGVRWMRHTIDSASEALPGGLDADVRLLVDAIDAVLADASVPEVTLEPGNILIVDNRRCLHGRSPIADSAASQRLLLRTKVRRGIDS